MRKNVRLGFNFRRVRQVVQARPVVQKRLSQCFNRKTSQPVELEKRAGRTFFDIFFVRQGG